MRKLFTLFAAAIVAATMYATEGALPGAFTINAQGDQIRFAKGNLQYQASTQTWRFAENQYDYVGDDNNGLVREGIMKSDNSRISDTYSGWIDLFGYATGNNPTVYDTDYDYSAGIDWGYNAISNGGNMPELWRCLTISEWRYIIYSRYRADYLKTKATVNGVKGAILLPDGWSSEPDGITMTLTRTDWTTNSYTKAQWEKLEAAGAVFFPAGGKRWKQEVTQAGESADYWALGYDNKYHTATKILTDNSYFMTPITGRNPAEGYAVRLVQPVEEPVDVHPVPPAKALTGRFSVAADKQVIFAQGNLTYNPAIGKWAFSKNQYDMEGLGNYNVFVNGNPESYNGWMDLFGWGTAANPTETSKESAAYTSFSDWTTNTIENADGKTWYTMTEDEWNYLLSTRADAASKQGQALVEDVKGYILLPDNWTLPAGLIFTPMPNNYTANVYTASQWEKLEAAGAVFLPAAGFRYGIDINGLNAGNGYYWTPTPSSQYDDMAQALMISEYSKAKVNFGMSCYGYSVRPVREVQASEAIEQTDASATFGGSHKLLRNGVLYILRPDGKTYNAQGAQVQ